MIKFKNLFSFAKKEIDYAFKHVQSVRKSPGLRLMQAPLVFQPEIENSSSAHHEDSLPGCPELKVSKSVSSYFSDHYHGKLLIIISRKTGKAHLRNLLRRRAKAIFYENQLYKKPALSLFSIYHEAAHLTYEQLEAFLLSCFPPNNS